MSVCVRLFIRLFAHITQKPCGWTSPNFLCMLTVAMAWSSSDAVAIHYVLPVLHMTSFFIPSHIQWVDGFRQNKSAGQAYKFNSAEATSTECNVRQLQCLVEFITMWHQEWSLLSMIALFVCAVHTYMPWGCSLWGTSVFVLMLWIRFVESYLPELHCYANWLIVVACC